MSAQSLRFADLIDLIDRLPLEERESLVEVVRRRNSEDARRRIAASVRGAKREHRSGKSKPTSPDELMREIHLLKAPKNPTTIRSCRRPSLA